MINDLVIHHALPGGKQRLRPLHSPRTERSLWGCDSVPRPSVLACLLRNGDGGGKETRGEGRRQRNGGMEGQGDEGRCGGRRG